MITQENETAVARLTFQVRQLTVATQSTATDALTASRRAHGEPSPARLPSPGHLSAQPAYPAQVTCPPILALPAQPACPALPRLLRSAPHSWPISRRAAAPRVRYGTRLS